MEKPCLVEDGVYRVPLILPESLEHERRELELFLLGAQRRIVKFAQLHGWKDLTRESFFDRAEIYDTKRRFDKALAKIAGAAEQIEFPKTYSAALENRVLMAVLPILYSENYPEGIEEDSYEKLLAHEIAHRLHIRILKGNEDAMGPIWFFEGFAIYAADQFSKDKSPLGSGEIQSIISATTRTSYRRYGILFCYLTRKAPVEDLIEHASKADFKLWLQEII
jgi:hypothetical protein